MLVNSINAALLINLVGFTVGAALYLLIAFMVIRHRRHRQLEYVDLLLLTTALLGSLWNLGELYAYVLRDFSPEGVSPWLVAASFSALGFLPSVVVHSAQADDEGTHWLTYGAYLLSIVAAGLHFYSVIADGTVPSAPALQAQTGGAIVLAATLLIVNFRSTLENKMIWAAALLIFALSGLHFIGEREGRSWLIEMVAHQSSLPLALAILYQNYRFAFADLFLKRAISLILLALTAFGLYTFVAAPLLRLHETHDRDDVQAIGLILLLWIATALVYPLLYRAAAWIVDKALLRRPNYAQVQLSIARNVEELATAKEVLDHICARLAASLTAGSSSWSETEEDHYGVGFVTVGFAPNDSRVFIPVAEKPYFEITLGKLAGGRRLLSDEISMLDAAASVAARRIDALRVTQERYHRVFREQEFARLATEAQLAALRAQINPHFLFNALTTIDYLIKADPAKASDTLIRLTRLLRAVLRSTDEFCTLGEEIGLIESYLEIERARFEEKLIVEIDVPKDLKAVRIPALIMQPLVENAIKHGISENKNGGTVRISAARDGENGHGSLRLTVWDSGAAGDADWDHSAGIGLTNVFERLRSYYGDLAKLNFRTANGAGTTVEIEIINE